MLVLNGSEASVGSGLSHGAFVVGIVLVTYLFRRFVDQRSFASLVICWSHCPAIFQGQQKDNLLLWTTLTGTRRGNGRFMMRHHTRRVRR